jgi:hypothetical protein
MNYDKVKKYFSIFSVKVPAILIIIGLITLAAGVGVFFLAAALIYILYKCVGTPSDEEYDNMCADHAANMMSKALVKLGVDEDEVKEIEPISFGGYCYSGYDQYKQGKDKKWRTDKYQSVKLFFSDNEVHVYTYTFTTTEDAKSEATDVYFYRDIVSVSTATLSAKIDEKNVDFECFRLTTAGGTALEVSLRDIDGAQRSINAMRQLLRAKKAA